MGKHIFSVTVSLNCYLVSKRNLIVAAPIVSLDPNIHVDHDSIITTFSSQFWPVGDSVRVCWQNGLLFNLANADNRAGFACRERVFANVFQ